MARRWKKAVCLLIGVILLTGCSPVSVQQKQEEGNGLRVVTTIFPLYDFARAIGKDKITIEMLLDPGAESHSYDPTPGDMQKIEESDIFIYIGGESESWVENILDSFPADKTVLRMMDAVDPVEEEVVEGMQEEKHGAEESHREEEHDHEEEYDEHIWTSPVNARLMAEAIQKSFCEADPANAAYYKNNGENFSQKLEELDGTFREIVKNGKRNIMIFADRFPCRYFTEEYGLEYRAAFLGCSGESEPSAATIAYLINRVKEDHIPVVFQIEFSNGRVASVLAEETGAAVRTFQSVHNITKQQFEAGITYLDLMEQNAVYLREALG
ncbi:metal ABC transporter substrate-binding protein [Anaerolentibacter hominis]|uniref:metal ABC transporter substrate-binding protein n=1 Tax=Anaerolentibacter hominis TaxID=3079009 RepID=UPI0031B886B8